MIKIAIVDDCQQFQDEMEKYLHDYEKTYNKSFSIVRFGSGIDFLSNLSFNPNIVLLDVDMPLMNGMDVAYKFRQVDSKAIIIFITNLAQYAINGYEVNASDFIVKPLNYYRFSRSLSHAISLYDSISQDFALVKQRDGVVKVYCQDIKYIEVINHKIIYHLMKDAIESTGTISAVEEELKDKGFSRCSNSYLINLKHVYQTKGEFIKVGDELIRVSRNRKKSFSEDLARYLCEIGGKN